eukprot:COSAG02_NODE_7486_length_2991_cov_1.293568_1_plen_32_part_10
MPIAIGIVWILDYVRGDPNLQHVRISPAARTT